MLRLFILLLAAGSVSFDSAEIDQSVPDLNVNMAKIARVSPTPMDPTDFAPLKRFAESYEPKSDRQAIPLPPLLDPKLSDLIANAAKTGSRVHEPYVVLIFLKLSRFNIEHFKQSYELGRENPLTKEFYRLIGETNYEKAEFMASYLVDNYVEKHPELLEYAPIKAEMKRIEKAGEKIKRGSRNDKQGCTPPSRRPSSTYQPRQEVERVTTLLHEK